MCFPAIFRDFTELLSEFGIKSPILLAKESHYQPWKTWPKIKFYELDETLRGTPSKLTNDDFKRVINCRELEQGMLSLSLSH
jgi:hypothetical protein